MDYRSPADENRNAGQSPPADEQAEHYAWCEAQAAQEYLNNHSTVTK